MRKNYQSKTNTMNTEQAERLLAEFMGGVYKISPVTLKDDKDFIWIGNNRYSFSEKFLHHPIQYATSYEWIMPVVERIEGMGYSVTIEGNTCEIYWLNWSTSASNPSSKLTAIFKACVAFVEWYKNQTQ